MRGALKKIDGVDEKSIDTDTSKRVVSFRIAEGAEYKSKLAELAEDNPHLAEFEIVN